MVMNFFFPSSGAKPIKAATPIQESTESSISNDPKTVQVQNAYAVIPIPSDPSATYYVIKKGGTKSRPTLTTKRLGISGESYATRVFNCNARTTKYLADSETLEGLKNSSPEMNMSMIVKDSIAWYQYVFVCK